MADSDLGICTMCEEEPATTSWGLPVCEGCAAFLGSVQGDLKAMEAEDPHLAELGRRVEESAAELFAERDRLKSPDG